MGEMKSSEFWKLIRAQRMNTINKINIHSIQLDKYKKLYPEDCKENREIYLKEPAKSYYIQGQQIKIDEDDGKGY